LETAASCALAAQYATMEEENRTLRMEAVKWRMERDMLKKATA